MKISDLQPRQPVDEITLDVTEIGTVREFQKFGKSGRVASAKARDETGEVILTLWNEQIDQVSVGDKVKIQNGYVGEWQGEKQLTSGRNGTITKI